VARHSLSQQLLDVIASREITPYALAKLAGVDPGIVARFVSGQRDITLATADRLALPLGVRLHEVAARAVRRKPAIASPSASAEEPRS
jgi:transcriptional regulator with XRE-family HTH domain